ncbi:alpha-amylase family glycosyl hydrolase [Ilumatobacter sp.]|uniref:glycoside hydrolase family 13 protein n=1 Tax=Ilumatobacter sp. TaxID=1967498 RepID=UPI00345DFB5C
MSPTWWRRGAVYQVYPRSFADANGDGTGDLAGIRSRLPYLEALGVDAIWISPWYPSPLNDGGYDVADYRDIDPRFGTLADAEELIADAHARGLRIIIDLVPNHTSSEHRWFRAALAAEAGSRERGRYVFKDGKGPDGSQPPTNWTSVFGGPAWHRVDDGQWYLHLFDPTQPDLNWENEEVRSEFDDVLRFWLDLGVDGFRVDVAHALVKDQSFPDLETTGRLLGNSRQSNHPHWDRDGVHEIIRRWRKVLDASERDVMMVAEAWVHPDRLPLYLRPDEYHQSFNFDFLETPWELAPARAAIDRAIKAAVDVGSTPTWTVSNHDVMRHATRYGLPGDTNWRTWPLTGPHDDLDPVAGLRRARAAALLLMALPGSVYLYQGEELGLPEVWDLPPDVLDDPVWENSDHEQKGRDGCRVPIPWTPDGPSLGFGTGDPWLPQPPGFGALSVASQTGVDGSTLEMYRTALGVRRSYLDDDESLEWEELGPDVLAFRRGSGVVCVVNFGIEPAALPAGDVLVTSAELSEGRLPTDAAAWVL